MTYADVPGALGELLARRVVEYAAVLGINTIVLHAAKLSVPGLPDPRTYALEIGLISELVSWFSDVGIERVRLNVEVHRP